jgi:hypothetical protein
MQSLVMKTKMYNTGYKTGANQGLKCNSGL